MVNIIRTAQGVNVRGEDFTEFDIQLRVSLACDKASKYSVELNGSPLEWDEYRELLREILKVLLS